MNLSYSHVLLAFIGSICMIVLPTAAHLAVMSIDLGSEYMKIAIVKPGVPMEIVLNRESSRKTRTMVAFRDDSRQFASDAYNTGVRFPPKAFWYLTHIVGQGYGNPVVKQFMQRFPYYRDAMVEDKDRGTILFRGPGETYFTIEELLAMILDQARQYAQEYAGQVIRDVVITVPPFYGQTERRAVLTAAGLADLNVLQLISDNVAVALNYGVFRRKNFNTTVQYYMFYDMGSSSTVATVVGYQMVKMKEGSRVEVNPQLTVKGVGVLPETKFVGTRLHVNTTQVNTTHRYDRSLGGLEMTLRLRDHLADIFDGQKNRQSKVKDNPRAMAKLLAEADRVKRVLSANSGHHAQVEGLLDEEDFSYKVTREQFYSLIEDLLGRVRRPVVDALRASEVTLPEINEVILMGGGSRLPKVQEMLLEYVNKGDVGRSINTDESAALGAVYRAAHLSKGFKVKTFHVRDGAVFPITVEFAKQCGTDGTPDKAKIIKRTLFGRMNPYPQRKVMTFNKHQDDFSFIVRYGDLDFLSEEDLEHFPSRFVANVSLSSVAESIAKHRDDGSQYKGVKVHFQLDDSGILHVDKVESIFEREEHLSSDVPMPESKDEFSWSKLGSAFGNLFGGKPNPTVEEANREPPAADETTVDANTVESDGLPQVADSKMSPDKEGGEGVSDDDFHSKDATVGDELDEKSLDSDKEGGESVSDDDFQSKDATVSDELDEKSLDSDKERVVFADSGQVFEDSIVRKQSEDDIGESPLDDSGIDKDGGNGSAKEEDGGKGSVKTAVNKSDEGPAGKLDKAASIVPTKLVTYREPISVNIDIMDIPDLSADRVTEVKKRLKYFAKIDKDKAALEKARNELESFVFDAQDKLTSQKMYVDCSTDTERAAILRQLSEASDWLYEQTDVVDSKTFVTRLHSLKDLTKDVTMRVYEKEERPRALSVLRDHLNHTSVFLAMVRNLTDVGDSIFTEVEMTTLERLANETEVWKTDALKEQAKKADYENPSLLVEGIGSKIYALDREMKYLLNKAKNFRSKPKVHNSSSSSNNKSSPLESSSVNETVDSDRAEVRKREEVYKDEELGNEAVDPVEDVGSTVDGLPQESTDFKGDGDEATDRRATTSTSARQEL